MAVFAQVMAGNAAGHHGREDGHDGRENGRQRIADDAPVITYWRAVNNSLTAILARAMAVLMAILAANLASAPR